MRRSLLLAAIGWVIVPTAFAVPPDAPRLRDARPSDELLRRHALMDVFEFTTTTTRGRVLRVALTRNPTTTLVTYRVRLGGTALPSAREWDMRLAGAGRRSVRLEADPDGSFVLRRGRRAVRLSMALADIDMDLRFARGVAGPGTRGWSLGAVDPPDERDTLESRLTASVPILRGRADGHLAFGSAYRVDVDRGHGTFSRVWGNFTEASWVWKGWDSVVVHQPRGRTWLALGMSRTDRGNEPQELDAQWSGFVVRRAGGRTRACRPRVRRTPDFHGGHDLSARCGGLRAHFRPAAAAASATAARVPNQFEYTYVADESWPTRSDGSTGLHVSRVHQDG